MEQCRIQVEDVFGPQVSGCYNDFDFTLLFEESVLYMPALLVATICGCWRLWELRSAPKVLRVRGARWYFKQLSWLAWTLLELTHLVLSLVLKTSTTRLSNAAIAIGFAVSPIFALVSHWEHTRSLRPSTVLNVYLLGTIPLDAARARTLSHMPGNAVIASIFIALVVCKFVLLVLEATGKKSLLARSLPLEQTAGIFDRSAFWWFNPLLLAGYKRSLTPGDLLAVDEDISLERSKEEIRQKWKHAKEQPRSLLKVLLAVYKRPLLANLLPRLCLTGVNYAQPFLVSRVTSFLGQSTTSTSKEVGYGLIAAYGIVYVGIAVMTAMFHHRSYRTVVMVRGGLILLIYDHTLSLNISAPSKGDSLTLINADIDRIGAGLRSFHETWASLLEIGLSLWLLDIQIGVSTVAAAAVVLACLLISGKVSGYMGERQKLWLEAMQTRITTTVAAINSIKGIKATGATNILQSVITQLRRYEIKSSIKFREVLVMLVTLSYLATTVAPPFSFGTYSILAMLRNTTPLTAATAYTSLTLLSLLCQAVASCIDALMGLVQALTSLERIRAYLALEAGIPLPDDSCSTTDSHISEPSPAKSTRSSESDNEKAMVRDTISGKIDPNAMIQLCNCSASWERFSKPVIQNVDATIPRGSFVMVIGPIASGKSSLLHTILGEIPHRTGTVVVHDVEVAFCGQTPWLVNTTIQNNILGQTPLDRQWYDTVVRACMLDRDFTQLPGGDNATIGSKGIMLSGGQKGRLALARALYARKPLVILDDVFAGLDAKTEQHVFTALFGPEGLLRQEGTTTVLATNSIRYISLSDYILVLGPGGTVVEQGVYSELVHSGGYLASLTPKEGRTERVHRQSDNQDPALTNTALRNANLNADNLPASDLAIYKFYVDQTGRVSFCVFFVLCSGFVVGLLFSQVWIKFWVEANARRANDRLGYYLGLYALWSVLAILLFLGACFQLMLVMVPKTAKGFHDRLLKTVLRAPLGFFSVTDSGEITNRFSQDLELVDMELPRSLIGTMMALVLCIGELVVVVYSSHYVAATVPFLIGLLYLVQTFYLKTSRQLRILEIEARAPLLSHFMETLQGLSSIRAFGWTRSYTAQNDRLLGTAQQSLYLLYCAQLWLTLVLDMIVAVLAIILVSIAVTTRTSTGASIGLALVNVVAFGANLKGLVYNWTALEIAMGAIARIRDFTSNTPSEEQPGSRAPPPPDWPQQGLIRFHDVSAAYNSESPSVLKNVSLEVQPGQKLAICGRTGSGKSSLVGSLLQLLDLRSGTIEIDGVDISTLARQDVRSRLITLPQEPFFYHGTIRENLDIHGQHSDEDLYEILARLGLQELIVRKGGLDVLMSEDMLSHGQRQLLCVVRASLRTSKILILDEATSSVDQETEALILDVLRERFRDHTVVCIAHRLNTILDYDQVIVLDQGRVVECGHPATLAAQPSIFAELLRATGEHSMSEH
ncbi:putative ABC multidrug transporter [Aspergillus fijiensis CBS 313.89]|uniref:Putative ABC multidrug transporter n=1 Tax=Aspergillus fijiensis CBS 313.89 TaxID=1448319 RepID=A0A8G1RSU3_9EURO|nr:putative ABC multidrug transporter [Aspergillus fijiensis CBS 313.89]RAK78057.1 putative ABC multidrug transporter [Aspergillus fijiensis CBS 313.89]